MAENTQVVTVRVTNEVAEWFKKDHNARKILTSLYNLVKSGRLYCSNEELVVSQMYRERVPINVDYKEKLDAMERRYIIERDSRREAGKRLDVLESEWQYILGDVSTGTLKVLEDTAIASGISLSGLIKDFCDKILSGVIEVDGGIVVNEVDKCPFDYRKFMLACDNMNKTYDYTMETVVKKIYQGEI